MAKKSSDRCWPGYEPVPGKPQHSEGSCRPKAKSKLKSGEKEFRAKRDRQLDKWQDEHKGSPRKAAQHLSKPGTAKKKPPARKSAASKPATRKATAKKASPRKSTAKKSAARKTTAKKPAAPKAA